MTSATTLTQGVFSVGPLCRSSQLGELARQAIIAEAELTPKPGLVDRRGSGSHRDLSLSIMRRSAAAIAPFFVSMALASSDVSFDENLRVNLARIGRNAEVAMLAATNGSNAHKGTIWALGLLIAAASGRDEQRPGYIAERAGFLARFPDHAQPQLITHGEVMSRRYGVAGARGEAYEGFPHVVKVGLPALQDGRRRGLTESSSRLCALLSIMAHLDDTCVLYRGGIDGLKTVKFGARRVLAQGGPGYPAGDAALRDLDSELWTLRMSPGGSADLLAATLFLDAIEQGRSEVEDDTSC